MSTPPAGPLGGRRILLGVSGGIAAYKTAELVRLLKKAGAEVQVLMTRNAARFITPLTLGTLSERPVLTDVWSEQPGGLWTQHIELGLWADVFLAAPATADLIARLAAGRADDMIGATVLAARCPVVVCPAMDHDMYVHPATQANLARLRAYGYEVVEPGYGSLASGLVGLGRLPEPADLAERLAQRFAAGGALAGRRVLVTAGPTREAIDPVRYLSNHSSGKMGYALAEAARRRGAAVTLVSGPTSLAAHPGIERIDVVSAEDMARATLARADAEIIIMAAAVADYTPEAPAPHKIKKADDALTLRLKRTTDILAQLGAERRPGQLLVGFALETEDAERHAAEKLRRKRLDWIVLNDALEPGAGFGHDTNRVTLLHCSGLREALPLASKDAVAEAILDRVTRPVEGMQISEPRA